MDTPSAAMLLMKSLGGGFTIRGGNPVLQVMIEGDPADCRPPQIATMDGMIAVNFMANWFGNRYPEFAQPEQILDALEWALDNPEELERQLGMSITDELEP